MRSSISLLALLPLALAQQEPLSAKAASWFDKAKSFIPSVPNPIDAGASAVAAANVEPITVKNYEHKLAPKVGGEEEWMIYLTGGNKSCFGRCGPVDLKWNESVPLLSALPQTNLKLGQVDCEKEAILCTGLAANCPSIYHFLIPAQGAANSKRPLHIVYLNISSVTVQDIVAIPSSGKATYANHEEYTGMLHPFDGLLAQTGLFYYFGYGLWILGTTPSWLMMIGISFVSRQIMSKRMTGGRTAGLGAPPAGGVPSAPGAVPAAAGPASPKGGSGGKKRK